MQNWFLLHTTNNFSEANILKGMLEENNVPAMLVNKQSSTYVMFGDIELYVPDHLKEVAKHLLDQN